MDDWSTLPDRNAVSEPAPNHARPLTRPKSVNPPSARLSPPRQAPQAALTTRAASRRLTRHASPGNTATNPSRAEPRKPLQNQAIQMNMTPISQPNVKNGQPAP